MKTPKASKKRPRNTLKSSTKSSVGSIDVSEIWPQERDIIFRPDRYKYIRKLIKPKGCVFCNCAKSKESFESLTLHKTKYSMVVLNKFPYNNGHLLVIPRRHCGDLTHLTAKEYTDLMDLLKKSMVVLKKVYKSDGFNLGMNHGAVAGAGIPEHLHWHIIPRWFGDVNFFPMIAETKVVVESLETTYHQIKVAWLEVL